VPQLVDMHVDAHTACARTGHHPSGPGSAPDFMKFAWPPLWKTSTWGWRRRLC